jgi:hypothetical protein
LGNVTDINEFKRAKDVAQSNPETDGDYLTIIVGETKEGEDIILIEQCEMEGTTEHKNTISMDEEMLHTLISELIVAAGIIKGKDL